MNHIFAVVALLVFIQACGRDNLEPSYLFDVYKSPDGQKLLRDEQQCASLGLRFTPTNELDSSTEAQVAMERPFLTYSGEIRALEEYIRDAHTLRQTFATKAPAELEPRQKVALDKISALSQQIVNADKLGRGAILMNETLADSFLKDSLELSQLEAALTKSGFTFRVIVGPNPVRIEQPEKLVAEEAKAFVQKSRAFQERYGHDLASPLVRLKADALEQHLAAAVP